MTTTSPLLAVKIARRFAETDDIISLEVVPVSGSSLPSFTAGSHVDVHVAPGLIRQYSLCNDPSETHRYLLGILREPESRGGSARIHAEFVAGHELRISPPRNNFHLMENAGHSMLLGGGIGITPMLAMAWRLHALGASYELHYCTRSLTRTAFTGLLKSAPFANRVFLHLDDGPDGQRFTVDGYLGEPAADRHLYVCGPQGFIAYAADGAGRLGWNRDHIHVEYFAADADRTGEAFTVRAARSGLTLTVPAGKSIAEALLENGIDVPLSCEQGVCGTCLTPVLGGVPDHRDMYLTDAEKQANDRMTVCCSRARSQVLVLDI
jgi:vanillate O-demethylase ferredoxin subunit